MLTVLATVVGVYWGGCFALAIVLAVIERREFIPPARLRHWRADARAFIFGWPVAAVVVPMIVVFDWPARRR